MLMRFLSYNLGFILIWVLTINNSVSQTNGAIKLADKLIELEKKHGIHFSYNHTFFDNIYLSQNINCNTISECLTDIEQILPIKFKNTYSKNYLITPIRTSIDFKIIDNETNENIKSIEYQINNKTRQNISSKDDVFTLENIFILDTIKINSYFYESTHFKTSDLAHNNTLKLYKKRFHLNEILLRNYITNGVTAKIGDHSLQIKTKALGLLAGETDGDIFNVLKNIPGIHSPSGKSGNLNFRGSTYDQNLILMDDIPIYHSGHLLGAISPYNTSIITNLEIQRNMLPVKFGGRVGGLINMTTSNKANTKTNYEIAMNTLFTGITINANLLDNKLSLLTAFRSNYPTISSPKLKTISNLIFQGSKLASVANEVNNSSNFNIGFSDLNVKLNYKINDNHFTSLSFITINNDLFAKVTDTDDASQTDFRDLDLNNWGVTAKWKANLSEKLTTELRLSKSNFTIESFSKNFLLNNSTITENYNNTISDTRLIAEANYNYTPNLIFELGYILTNHQLINNEVEVENDIESQNIQKGTIHSSYLSLQKNWNNKLNINFGFHNNYYQPLKKFYFNPRLSISYSINNNLYLKHSLGTSNQFIQKKMANDFDDFNITNQFWFLQNNTIKPLKGNQIMFGAVFNKNKWLIDLELYHKKTNNITNKADNTQGDITSLGTNIFIKKRWGKLETWISYALSEAKTNFNNTNATAFFDQKHLVNITGLLNLKRWEFALSWGYFSGAPIIYPNETDNSTLTPNLSDRFNGLHQLDFSTSFTLYNNSKSLKSVIGLSIQNIYNQDNTVNVFQNSTENTFRKSSKFSPNLQLNLFF